MRTSTADVLMDLDYEVMEAGSVEEAMRLLDDSLAPDLLVTEHLVPGISGTEPAREMWALCPHLPVQIVSGYARVGGIAPDLPRLRKPFRNAVPAASLTAAMLSVGG